MRLLQHPGPVAAQRHDLIEATLTPIDLTLLPGRSLLGGIAEAVGAHGAESAVLSLAGGALDPYAYVMPATSKTAAHAVYFSERHQALGPVRLDAARVTFGRRAGAPWLHAHVDWRDARGVRHCGHVLPAEALITEAITAQAWLLDGAAFEVRPDAETGFTLFRPVTVSTDLTPAQSSRPGVPALALRLAPNQDVCHALEAICRARGITRATVRGGVGSTVGAVFDDGRRVEPHITEVLIRQGRIRPDAQGAPVAEIDVTMVDHHGGVSEGRLQRGANAVLVTFELVLEPAPEPTPV